MTVKMLVDSDAYMMGINETIQEQLNLSFIEKRIAVLADGSVREYDVVGPIHAKFKNCTAICSAMVLKGDSEPLLGSIPMEEMDVLIDPQRRELIVNPKHPYLEFILIIRYGSCFANNIATANNIGNKLNLLLRTFKHSNYQTIKQSN